MKDNLETKEVLICPECKNELAKVDNIYNLPAMPYHWFNDDTILERYDIYYCMACSLYFQKPKTKKHNLKDIILNIFFNRVEK